MHAPPAPQSEWTEARLRERQKTNSITGGEGKSIQEWGKPCLLGPLLPGAIASWLKSIHCSKLIYMKNMSVPLWPQQWVQLPQPVPVGEWMSSCSAHTVRSWETCSYDMMRPWVLPHTSWSMQIPAVHWPKDGAGRAASDLQACLCPTNHAQGVLSLPEGTPSARISAESGLGHHLTGAITCSGPKNTEALIQTSRRGCWWQRQNEGSPAFSVRNKVKRINPQWNLFSPFIYWKNIKIQSSKLF